MRVKCEVAMVELEGDSGAVDGVCVTCTRCEHAVEVFGTNDNSVRRGLATLRQQCPRGERNFYSD